MRNKIYFSNYNYNFNTFTLSLKFKIQKAKNQLLGGNGIFMIFNTIFIRAKNGWKYFECAVLQQAAWLFCKWWFLCVTFEINNHSSMSDKKLLLALLGKRGSDGLWGLPGLFMGILVQNRVVFNFSSLNYFLK